MKVSHLKFIFIMLEQLVGKNEMKKNLKTRTIFKFTLITLGLALAFLFFLPFLSSYFPNLNKNDLKEIIKKETGLELKEQVKVKKYKNLGVPLHARADFVEIYEIELSPNEYSELLALITSNKESRWGKTQNGYQLVVPPINLAEAEFIFYLDPINSILEIQVID